MIMFSIIMFEIAAAAIISSLYAHGILMSLLFAYKLFFEREEWVVVRKDRFQFQGWPELAAYYVASVLGIEGSVVGFLLSLSAVVFSQFPALS